MNERMTTNKLTPEDRIRRYFNHVSNDRNEYGENRQMYMLGERGGIMTTLAVLGIKIEGVTPE